MQIATNRFGRSCVFSRAWRERCDGSFVHALVTRSFLVAPTLDYREVIREERADFQQERCSEREPAESLTDKWNVIGGWLPSLTLALGGRVGRG